MAQREIPVSCPDGLKNLEKWVRIFKYYLLQHHAVVDCYVLIGCCLTYDTARLGIQSPPCCSCNHSLSLYHFSLVSHIDSCSVIHCVAISSHRKHLNYHEMEVL